MSQPAVAPASRAHVRRAARPAPFAAAPHDRRWWRSREIDVIEDERRRLARDLHDEAGHRLTAASLKLDELAQRRADDAELRASLEYVRALVWECTTGLHDVAFNLRPAILADLGLVPALRSLVRRAQEATTIDLAVEVEGTPDRLPERAELAGFRIAQEALTNALKYANASRISIIVRFSDDGVVLEIVDDGIGFDLSQAEGDRPRLGLKGMQERVDLVGGRLRLRSRSGYGTRVWVSLPRDEVA